MIYQCNDIEIDTSNFCLSKKGKLIAIEPKVFDVIAYLIRNKGRLVSRQEIFENIWGGKFVCDTSLSNHIKNARHALGDNGQQQQIIRTIYGRGYQFVASAKKLVNHKNHYIKPSTNQHERKRKTFSRLSLNLTNLHAGQSKVPLFYNIDKPSNNRGIKSYCLDTKSIAVLAFEDFSPKHNLEYFSHGVSQEILNLLTEKTNLRVISQTSSFSYKRKDDNIKKIGKELGATHILEGSVRKFHNNIRISTQLIEVFHGSCLWSETYKRKMDDIFKIQDEVANIVKKKLTNRLL